MYDYDEVQPEPMIRPPEDASLAVDVRLRAREVYIDYEQIQMVTASLLDWLGNTKEGLDYMSYLQRMDVTPASSNFNYTIRNMLGVPFQPVASSEVEFRTCCIVEGVPMSQAQLHIEERERVACSSCGARVICMDDGHTLCTHCEEFSMEDYNKTNNLRCEGCTDCECSWHPSKHEEESLLERYTNRRSV